jgi:DNA-binding response OmpR family regulator
MVLSLRQRIQASVRSVVVSDTLSPRGEQSAAHKTTTLSRGANSREASGAPRAQRRAAVTAQPAQGLAAPSHAPELARLGRAQLAQRLDAIERVVAMFAAQAEESAWLRRVAREVRAEVARARSLSEALERLVALEQTTLRLGQVEISDLLIATLSRWKTRATQQTFELALPGHEPTVLGDGVLIEQALEGLIAWAVAHSAPGDIRVSLRPAHPAHPSEALASDGMSDEVTIAVRCPLRPTDGMQAGRLFERFAEPQGNGEGDLELALARAVVERHGGRAWAEVNSAARAVTLSLALPTAPSPALQPTPTTLPATAHAQADAAALGSTLALARAQRVVVVAHADARMARYLRANLEAAEFSAMTATSLNAALKLIEQEEPELVLLDLMLPDDEQREPLERALARTTAPIIALGQSADPAACVRALDVGAADFIAQPLSVEETLARIRRALRPPRGQAPEPRARMFTCGDLVIDDTQRLVTVGGTPAQLSKIEYRLLRTLAQNLGKTLSHEALLAQVWGPAYSKEIEFIWVYIRRLRRKIEPDPARPRYILTAPGIGYRLAQPPAQSVTDADERG